MNTLRIVSVTTFVLAAVLGAGGCSSSSSPSAGSGPDAATSDDAPGPTGDGASQITPGPGDASGSLDASGQLEAGNDSGVKDSGGDTGVSCGGGPLGPPASHRATDVACTPGELTLFPDGGPACTTDAECADAGSAYVTPTCLAGRCSADQCLVDSDCAAGSACGCASSYYGGNAAHPNRCFPSTCRVDADCGAGGYCSPSLGAYCGGLTGFFCHQPTDTCHSNSDCSCGSSLGGTCYYEPTVSHWQCEAAVVCAG